MTDMIERAARAVADTYPCTFDAPESERIARVVFATLTDPDEALVEAVARAIAEQWNSHWTAFTEETRAALSAAAKHLGADHGPA